VNLYYKAYFGTLDSGLNTGVASFQGVLWYLREWPEYWGGHISGMIEFALQGILWCLREWPEYWGGHISGVNLHYKAYFGTLESGLNTGVATFQG
jgi:hypothetical protein